MPSAFTMAVGLLSRAEAHGAAMHKGVGGLGHVLDSAERSRHAACRNCSERLANGLLSLALAALRFLLGRDR